MKREIKFRAWNSETKKMMLWSDIQGFGNLNKLISLSFVDVMQFTGLEDENKTDIYEGDILEHNGGVKKVVFYNAKKGSYYCRFQYGGGFVDHINYFTDRNCKVIGNIYE